MAGSSTRSVALVTGAGRGIGLGIAEALCAAGLKVALADVAAASAEQSASSLCARGHEAIGLTLDVSDAAAWARAVAEVTSRWGGIDVLVNNAGISPRGTIDTTDEELWDRTLSINLKGAWLGIKSAIGTLRARKGTIINVGSTHSVLPMKGLFSYCVSKAGLLGLTRQVAAECLDEVTCNLIAPGWVASPGEIEIQKAAGRLDFPHGIRNMSSADDVGAAAVYLVSDAARRMTGTIFYLDGGLHLVGDVAMVHMPKT